MRVRLRRLRPIVSNTGLVTTKTFLEAPATSTNRAKSGKEPGCLARIGPPLGTGGSDILSLDKQTAYRFVFMNPFDGIRQ